LKQEPVQEHELQLAPDVQVGQVDDRAARRHAVLPAVAARAGEDREQRTLGGVQVVQRFEVCAAALEPRQEQHGRPLGFHQLAHLRRDAALQIRTPARQAAQAAVVAEPGLERAQLVQLAYGPVGRRRRRRRGSFEQTSLLGAQEHLKGLRETLLEAFLRRR
jgi:hypothetical protein